ncbi:hypothetical protein [Sphingomonas sp. MMS24-J13]|uniref:hypothetical protein n=1 Tax=Sphingomonas sp. MMS24-J13 TaxID=3238686 RepID=UPI00384D9600
MRDAARLALSFEWTLAGALDSLAGEDLGATITAYEASLAPLNEIERLERDENGHFGRWMTELRTWLKPIGMKISPTMSPEQCSAWLTAVAIALSDLPPKVATQAARAAIHIPMSFMNEVDGHVRAEAIKIMGRHKTALRRLHAMQAEILRAANPQPALSAPDPFERYTAEEIRRMSPHIRSIGLTCGALTQAEIDEADAGDSAGLHPTLFPETERQS